MTTVTVRVPAAEVAIGRNTLFQITVDGALVARLDAGEQTSFEVATGPHRLAVRAEWPRPAPVDIDVGPDDLWFTLLRDPTGGAARSGRQLGQESAESAAAARPRIVRAEERVRPFPPEQERRVRRALRWGVPRSEDRELAWLLYRSGARPGWWRITVLAGALLNLIDLVVGLGAGRTHWNRTLSLTVQLTLVALVIVATLQWWLVRRSLRGSGPG